MEKIQELKKQYDQEPRKGIQAEAVLQEYLKSKESVTDAILQTDQTLSEKEKLIEVMSHPVRSQYILRSVEQARLLKEGFRNENKQLQNEIQKLQKKMEERPSCVLS
ncbi:Guanylate-binding protein 1 [Camelus dromedarius]|uniref:Guanylate-binding protein 1 n=1 Tax=Camelus dromedarius TaxID=9838 RepID=A0A5N4DDE9_CAMDR|nr:Guanylate-binding protein 1 [Camelus dromedarius]